MNILIISDKSRNFGGGINKHCKDLYNLFKNDEDIKIQAINNLPSIFIPILNKNIVEISSLKKCIKDSNCDIVHIHGFMSVLVIQSILIASLLKKKIIYSPHFHPFKYLNRPFLGKVFFILFLKPLLKRIETIITINNEDTSFFSLYHSNVRRIPHWLEQESIKKHIPRKNNMILFVGRNDSNKGLEHLYTLPLNKYEIHCVTGGILKRKDFIQHKNISDQELSKLYRETNVVVVPSRYEAFSLVALEALYNHSPIVISERVRIGDYLKDIKGCTIFQYRNFKEFEVAIEETIHYSNIDFNVLLLPFSRKTIKQKYKDIYLNINTLD